MRVTLLGALTVVDGERVVAVGGARLRALLARLALDAGRPVSAAALVDAVWEDALPADETHALHSLVSRLRRELGSAELVAQAPGGGYRLAVAPEDVDAHRFERLAAEGGALVRAGDAARGAAVLREALALWDGGGAALGGLGAERAFARVAAARLEDVRLGATLDRIETELTLGGAAAAAPVAELERLAADHPLDERVARLRLRTLAAAGRQADALAVYERVRTALDEELGALPGPELQAAHLAVLRGETEPAPAARATPPDAPAPAPAPASAPSRRTNLRVPLTSFVGRDREVAALGDALTAHRLVTLLGPGGAGKTRLAQEAAARCLDHVPDGVWLVELAPVREEAEVAPVVLASLGLRDASVVDHRPTPMPAGDALQRLLDLLADRRALLVLDNCEHLIGAAAALADELLGRCPQVRIVATSREPLGIGGEQLFEVPPLAWPPPHATPEEALTHPAVELFADRAAAARPGFAVDADTVAPVVELCRRLDGQPLAIELAAARVRSLPPHELARRLDDRFRLLTGGSRTALPRHRTLRAVVDWSWDLLTAPERALARRLAVLAARFTPAAAEAVCAGPDLDADDVLDTLAGLVDRSLVQVADPAAPRYRMLETIREYGLERLEEAGETKATRDAHARHFAGLALELEPRLKTAEQLPAFRTFERERENLVAALRHLAESGDARTAHKLALALTWFTVLSGEPSDALPFLRLAAASEGDADPDERVFVREIVAINAHRETPVPGEPEPGALDAAFKELARGSAERLAAVDGIKLPLAQFVRAMALWIAGDRVGGEAAIDGLREHPDPWVRAITPLMRAQLADNEGEVDRLRTELAEALPALRAVGDRWALALALVTQANVLMLDGDLDAAGAALDEARTITVELSTRGWTAVLELRLAELLMRRGDADAARAALTRMEVTHDLSPEEELIVLAMRARVAWFAGDRDEGRLLRRRLEQVVDGAALGGPERGHGLTIAYAAMAGILVEEGELERAEALLTSAHPVALGTRDMPLLSLLGLVVAHLAEARGRLTDAAELLGASARVRGAEDEHNHEIAQLAARLRAALGEEAYAAAYGRGLAADRDAAVARLHPAAAPLPAAPPASDPAGVGP